MRTPVCPHCETIKLSKDGGTRGTLKLRGQVGSAGALRWKCRTCGRTGFSRHDGFLPPLPLQSRPAATLAVP